MSTQAVEEGMLLWEPTDERKRQANITHYMAWLKEKRGLSFEDYGSLWEWSVSNIEEFWKSIWAYHDVQASQPYKDVLSNRTMPGSRWFPGGMLNYAEHIFRNRIGDEPALLAKAESGPVKNVTWAELSHNVSSVASQLRELGVVPGDRVVSYLPNVPEAVIALLATVSLGAVWSSCSPDFGSRSVIDRFKQIEPKVLFATDGYVYGGKEFDRRPIVNELRTSLEKLTATVMVPCLYPAEVLRSEKGPHKVLIWGDVLARDGGELRFEQVPFDHPLWIVYSSGTTGLPKALVQSHGGILLEQFKYLGLQFDLKPGDRMFWFSTTGWIMWNILISSLLHGATAILFDGNPAYPDMDTLWKLAESTRMNVFGTGAPFLIACMRQGMNPAAKFDLSHLKVMGSTGAPLSPEGFQWVYEKVKGDLLLGSTSGGTDVCTGFLGPCPLLPVKAGELQCRCLGVKAEAFNEKGKSVIDEVGELVITEPMPSMPLFLWNDPDNRKYEVSYFDLYPGVWRHGDWIKIKQDGSSVIHGRSDSTLKRMGVRMGSSEIYSAVESLEEVADSLIVGYEMPDDRYYMPLFVVLRKGLMLDEALKKKIKEKIRSTLTPRHVPDAIYAVPDIPKTLNNKKLEVPVKKILMGVPVEKAVSLDSVGNPASIDTFKALYKKISG